MKKAYIPIVLIAIIVVILLVHVNYLRFVCDDAFISFRYAKNFVEGHGLVYNIGERVEGYSNFLWTLLLSLFMKMGLDPVTMSQVLGVLFSLGTVFLLLRLNRCFYPKHNLFNYLAPLFLACCGAYAAWSTGGLETSLFTFLVLLGSFFLISGIDPPKRLAWSGLIFALVCMTRPDGLILALVTFGFLLYLALSRKKVELKGLLLWSLFFLIPFFLYFIWRWSYYGKMLPNTFYIKVAGAAYYNQGFSYLLSFVERFWIWFMAAPLLFLGKVMKLNPKLRMVVLYFTSMILAFCCYVVYVGGDFMDMFRFFVPILPFFFFLVQEGFRGMNSNLRLFFKGRYQSAVAPLNVFMVGLLLLLLAYPSRASNMVWSRGNIDSIGLLREYAHVWSKAGLALKIAAKSGASLSTTAAGAMPYYSGLYTIDELGLTLLVSRPEFRPRPVGKTGHRAIITDEFVLSKRPTFVVGHPGIFYEHELAGGVAGSRRQKTFAMNGYEMAYLPVRIAENEVKYLIYMTPRGSPSDDPDQLPSGDTGSKKE
jgi:arabinofuranosyltransferase